MFNVILYQPEIPPNTGNIIRLASNTGCRLHLIEPLGFKLEDKSLRRAGLDYHEYSELISYVNWNSFIELAKPERILAFSTKGKCHYSEVAYEEHDFLLFGPETRGLPADILASPVLEQVLTLPMKPESRSLNLSNSVAVVVYEAWRQNGFAGAQ